MNSTDKLANRLPSCGYIPILSVRPAEMKALEELPEHDKNTILPVFLIRPWTTSNELRNTFSKLAEVYGPRTWIGDFDPNYSLALPEGETKQVHEELKALQDPKNGYENWCSFLELKPNIIPCVQLSSRAEFGKQLRQLNRLGRGIVVRLPKQLFGLLGTLLAELSLESPSECLMILDYGQVSVTDLPSVAQASGLVQAIASQVPSCRVAISATTFPDSFAGLSEERIEERAFFARIVKASGNASLIYSDRGSAREERRQGGGGPPVPRIDYPLWDSWRFYREDEEDGYQVAAKRLMRDRNVWNPFIRIWGTQMIERTASGDRFAIQSPVRSTAVRINLHLHRQIFYSDRAQITDELEDDWVD